MAKNKTTVVELAKAQPKKKANVALENNHFIDVGTPLPMGSKDGLLSAMTQAVSGKRASTEAVRHADNPLMPEAYVTPKSTEFGRQIGNQDAETIRERRIRKKKQRSDMAELVELVGRLVKTKSEPVEAEVPTQPVLRSPNRAKVAAVDTAAQLDHDFSSLKIPKLGPTATKPNFRVQFDLGELGKQEAWYHWINEHDDCLFLIYDTRFEYGIRYSPPNLGPDKPIRIRLPDHRKEYNVYSMDFSHPFGVFYITSLIIVKAGQHRQMPGAPPRLSEVIDLTASDMGFIPEDQEPQSFDDAFGTTPTFFEQQDYDDDKDWGN